MPVEKLKRFLDEHQVRYVSIAHSPAYTAQEVAASAHISGKEVAKTVMVHVDGRLAMAVLRATDRVDTDQLRSGLGAQQVALAGEEDFAGNFPGVDPGAMPPFGNLYEMPVYVDETLTHDEQIAFNAGSHAELIRLAYADYERLVEPKVLRFASD